MQVINTLEAPQAIGPYSQAMKVGNLLFASGQIPLDADGNFVDGDITVQTKQVLKNVQAVLAAENLTLANVVKTTVFTKDLKDFPIINEIYAATFGDHKPARTTIEVAGLPLGSKVEIEVIAELP